MWKAGGVVTLMNIGKGLLMEAISIRLSREMQIKEQYVENVIRLIDEGNTIPFIARYRKEQHGAMDDTQLRNLADRLHYLRNLDQRCEEVKKAIMQQGKLTPELQESIEKANSLAEVEDLYRPFKQKRRTRATIAKEKGLEPLAQIIFGQAENLEPLTELAQAYLYADREIETEEQALAGAHDIIAEWISENASLRKALREYMIKQAVLSSEAAQEDQESVYQLYYTFSQPVAKLHNHQILAINRGEKEGKLKVSLAGDRVKALHLVWQTTVISPREAGQFVKAAGEDAYDRLIAPSLEREIRSMLTQQASASAIENFAWNLKQLLMQPPVKGKVTMGLDPGYRNGCKVAVVDGTGKVLATTVVYPTHGQRQKEAAIETLEKLVRQYRVAHLAIGNGTASRETEQMAVELIEKTGGELSYMMVNEAGASVYSASQLAAEEFPQFDVNLRSAVSIARRMQDPLAELVKIDPKAIGVGQYQHDMPERELDEALNGVVEDCVNAVGVDVNTASASLLKRISGLNQTTAKNIVLFREANGPFTQRKDLQKVPKLGPKAYEQCAGFLRVPESQNVLDNTGVHPESYGAAEKVLSICGYGLQDVVNGNLSQLTSRAAEIGEKELAEKCGLGVPTLQDVVKELCKPGRDPREELPPPILRTDVLEMKDLKPGMILQGTVRNVIDFGAFVDIGVHQDGLVHISQISDQYIRHPSQILHVGQVVKVAVLDVDEKRKRIGLSMKNLPQE